MKTVRKQMIIIKINGYLKPYNSVWIISIRLEYLKLYKLFVLDRNTLYITLNYLYYE